MRYPKFLKEKGKIGVCAPSFGTVIEPYISLLDSAIENFTALGHEVILTNSVRKQEKCRSASGEVRAKEFMNLYVNDDIDVIISQAGGEVMCEILSYLDFDKISKLKPKWFLGYSDNTILTFLLPILADVASIYGDCFSEFGMRPWYKTLDYDYKLLKGENLVVNSLEKYEVESLKYEPGNALTSYNLTEESSWSCLSNEKEFVVEGRVLAGCLDLLVTLCGTKYDKVSEFIEKYKDEGIIWFVESCDLNIFSQLRAFWQLKNAGWFKYAKAIIIGRAKNKEEAFGVSYHEANFSELKELNIPIVIDADFGHVAPRLPIISGGYALIEYKDKKATITYLLK